MVTLKRYTIVAVNDFIKTKAKCMKLSYDEKGIMDMIQYLKTVNYDIKNYAYSEDWALGQYRDFYC